MENLAAARDQSQWEVCDDIHGALKMQLVGYGGVPVG